MATDEFTAIADYELGHFLHDLGPEERALASQTEFEVEYLAQPYHKAATGTPDGYTLLAMYMWQPHPKVILFEESLRKKAAYFGSVAKAVYEAIKHEVEQHHFGRDHTKEEIEHGHAPAFMLPNNEEEEELPQWQIHRLMGLH